MTIAVDWEVKQQNKQTNKISNTYYALLSTCSTPEDLKTVDWDVKNNKFSFLKEGLPSLKHHVHLVSWKPLQIWLLFTLH